MFGYRPRESVQFVQSSPHSILEALFGSGVSGPESNSASFGNFTASDMMESFAAAPFTPVADAGFPSIQMASTWHSSEAPYSSAPHYSNTVTKALFSLQQSGTTKGTTLYPEIGETEAIFPSNLVMNTGWSENDLSQMC